MERIGEFRGPRAAGALADVLFRNDAETWIEEKRVGYVVPRERTGTDVDDEDMRKLASLRAVYVHHGNGTQEIFYENEQVGFLSIHRYPFYPGTGNRDETGTGAGLGRTLNIPLPHGTPPAVFQSAFRSGLHKLADRIKPELVLVSAGFDAHAEDPVGDLGLEIEDFEILTKEIVAIAQTHAQGRIVSVLEGGYNTSILSGCVTVHLDAMGAERGKV